MDGFRNPESHNTVSLLLGPDPPIAFNLFLLVVVLCPYFPRGVYPPCTIYALELSVKPTYPSYHRLLSYFDPFIIPPLYQWVPFCTLPVLSCPALSCLTRPSAEPPKQHRAQHVKRKIKFLQKGLPDENHETGPNTIETYQPTTGCPSTISPTTPPSFL